MALPRMAARLARQAPRLAGRLPARQSTPMLSRPSDLSAALPPGCAPRPFSSSRPVFMKRKIAQPANDGPVPGELEVEGERLLNLEEPLDVSRIKDAYEPIDAHFKSQLRQIVNGGRFNVSAIGALRVHVRAESGSPGQTYPLRDLAQIVTYDRSVSLLVHDGSYIKGIMSAIQASPHYNQQPQQSPDNELELTLRIELQRREDLVTRTREAAQGWKLRVRAVRAKINKALQDWQQSGDMGPDLARRTERKIQKLQDLKLKEIKEEESLVIAKLYNKR